MPGDFGLWIAEDLNEVADADLLLSDEIEEAEPGLVAERLEEALQVEGIAFWHVVIFALTHA